MRANPRRLAGQPVKKGSRSLVACHPPPPQVWRTISDDALAPSAAVAMMQAPCSLNALTCGGAACCSGASRVGRLRRSVAKETPREILAMTGAARFVSVAPSWGVLQRAGIGVLGLGGGADGGGGGGGGAAILTHFLFAASTVVLWLNIYAVWRRRAAIVARGIQTDWRVVIKLIFIGMGHNIAAHVGMLSPNAPPPAIAAPHSARARSAAVRSLSFSHAGACV